MTAIDKVCERCGRRIAAGGTGVCWRIFSGADVDMSNAAAMSQQRIAERECSEVAAERERCAAICEDAAESWRFDHRAIGARACVALLRQETPAPAPPPKRTNLDIAREIVRTTDTDEHRGMSWFTRACTRILDEVDAKLDAKVRP